MVSESEKDLIVKNVTVTVLILVLVEDGLGVEKFKLNKLPNSES